MSEIQCQWVDPLGGNFDGCVRTATVEIQAYDFCVGDVIEEYLCDQCADYQRKYYEGSIIQLRRL